MNDMVDCLQINGVSDFPIASSSLSGVALDDEHIQYLSDAPRIVRTGGRIVAPAHAIMPHGCEELARDSTEWVAVVTATPSMPITLRRGDVTSG